ncbi:unnamed protein product [Vicia faba]|uniref:Pentatricopeptide repeat-containing protein n=1 Tax=Vicia faba TaxID=3906 RepID=A0AAV0Z5Q9_VICFA|nr:unnamed protein product [Vicia faba]
MAESVGFDNLDSLVDKTAGQREIHKAFHKTEYLCLTSNYIDESWQFRKRIFNFIRIDPSHTQDMLSAAVMSCLKDWDIERKLFSMILDSCSSCDNTASRISEKLMQNMFLYCKGQLFDICCVSTDNSELKERCLVYDSVVNTTYMDGFFNQGRDNEGMDSYKLFMDCQFRMLPATSNVLLEVFLKHGKQKEAWELFDQMLDNHTPPNFQAVNFDTLNAMVNECFKLGKIDEVVAAFRKVDYTFTCISGVFLFIL